MHYKGFTEWLRNKKGNLTVGYKSFTVKAPDDCQPCIEINQQHTVQIDQSDLNKLNQDFFITPGTYTFDEAQSFFIQQNGSPSAMNLNEIPEMSIFFVDQAHVYLIESMLTMKPITLTNIQNALPQSNTGFYVWHNKAFLPLKDSNEAKFLSSQGSGFMQSLDSDTIKFGENTFKEQFEEQIADGWSIPWTTAQALVQQFYGFSILKPHTQLSHFNRFAPSNDTLYFYDSNYKLRLSFDAHSSPAFKAVSHNQSVKCLLNEALNTQLAGLKRAHIKHASFDFSGIRSLALTFNGKINALSTLNAGEYEYDHQDNTLWINHNTQNTISESIFFEREELECCVFISKHFTPSIYLTEPEWEHYLMVVGLALLYQQKNKGTFLNRRSGIVIEHDKDPKFSDDEMMNQVIEVFTQNEDRFCALYSYGVCFKIPSNSSLNPGFYYLTMEETLTPIPLDSTLAIKMQHSSLLRSLDTMNQADHLALINENNFVHFKSAQQSHHIPIIGNIEAKYFKALSQIPTYTPFCEYLLGVYNTLKPNTSFSLSWHPYKQKWQAHSQTFQIVSEPMTVEAFYQKHTVCDQPTPTYPSIYPHLILPSSTILSAIFVGTGVINMPAFTMALMAGSSIGALALQIAIYQTDASKDFDSFLHSPWILYNAITFGLAAMTYFSLMANPLQALIGVTSIMTMAPFAVRIHDSYQSAGLFNNKTCATDLNQTNHTMRF